MARKAIRRGAAGRKTPQPSAGRRSKKRRTAGNATGGRGARKQPARRPTQLRASARPQASIGIIGGSGLYAMEELLDVRTVAVTTPFGPPSDRIVLGRLDDVRLAFLPRHGRGHRYSPTQIPFRANIYALKALGVDTIIAVSAVGSLRAEIAPGDLVIPDQFIDRTRGRVSTFFADGVVAHVGFADPVCPQLSAVLVDAGLAGGATVHPRGTYVCMEGPQFSTRAESELYRMWGAHVIGMTNLQEAKLAREAEICFGTIAMVTDFDCWKATAGDVDVQQILRVLSANVSVAKRMIAISVRGLQGPRTCACGSALQDAIITDRAAVSSRARRVLGLLAGKYLT